jgi:hypothetical protein
MNDANAYTIGDTRVDRDHWKRWNARTQVKFTTPIVDVDMGREKTGHRVINLHTYRQNTGALATFASVAFASERMESTMLFQDYSKRVATESLAGVLEKDIRRQHAAVVARIPEIVAEVVAFYAKADARRAPATNRPGDMAAAYAAETGVSYSAALVACNMD